MNKDEKDRQDFLKGVTLGWLDLTIIAIGILLILYVIL